MQQAEHRRPPRAHRRRSADDDRVNAPRERGTHDYLGDKKPAAEEPHWYRALAERREWNTPDLDAVSRLATVIRSGRIVVAMVRRIDDDAVTTPNQLLRHVFQVLANRGRVGWINLGDNEVRAAGPHHNC